MTCDTPSRYRIHFVDNDTIARESDALRYANGCAARFNGQDTSAYRTGADLWALVTIPAPEVEAFLAMLEEDDCVDRYKLLNWYEHS